MGWKNSPVQRMLATFGELATNAAPPLPPLELLPDPAVDAAMEVLQANENEVLWRQGQNLSSDRQACAPHRLDTRPDNRIAAQDHRRVSNYVARSPVCAVTIGMKVSDSTSGVLDRTKSAPAEVMLGGQTSRPDLSQSTRTVSSMHVRLWPAVSGAGPGKELEVTGGLSHPLPPHWFFTQIAKRSSKIGSNSS